MTLAVIGIGCRAAGDDAVGVRLVEALAAASPTPGDAPAGVSYHVWADADALTLAHDLLGLTAPVLVVDCLDFASAAGDHRVVEDAPGRLHLAGRAVSSHGFGLADALALAEALGFRQRVDVFGIQPAQLGPRIGLSRPLRRAFPALLSALRAEVARRAATGGPEA